MGLPELHAMAPSDFSGSRPARTSERVEPSSVALGTLVGLYSYVMVRRSCVAETNTRQ